MCFFHCCLRVFAFFVYGVAGGIACVFFIWCSLGAILESYSLETLLKL